MGGVSVRRAGREDVSAIERVYEAAGWHPDGARRDASLKGSEFVELRYRIELPRRPRR